MTYFTRWTTSNYRRKINWFTFRILHSPIPKTREALRVQYFNSMALADVSTLLCHCWTTPVPTTPFGQSRMVTLIYWICLRVLNHRKCFERTHYTNELRAIRDIRKGEEVTTNYKIGESLFDDTATRQEILYEGWNFLCSCHLCSSGRDKDRNFTFTVIEIWNCL